MTYLEQLANEIHEAVAHDLLPEEDVTDLFLMYAVLLLAKGEQVRMPDVHNAWVAWMISQRKAHESMVPFAKLPASKQAEDSPFVQAIQRIARIRKLRSDVEC
jgi:hypothetical protein